MIKFIEEIDFKEYELIIPSVSVGNVGQLAVDLLLNTLPVTKIGYVWHSNIIPIVAYDPKNKSVVTACELFVSKDLKIVILQIRSTFGKFSSIAPDLLEISKTVKRVVILTGSFAYERREIHLVAEPFRYLSTRVDETVPAEWKVLNANWKSGEAVRLPGSGIADSLFTLCDTQNIAALLIVEFVSEGDNRVDAINMCDYLDSWMNLRAQVDKKEGTWKVPSTWDNIFGKTYPRELF